MRFTPRNALYFRSFDRNGRKKKKRKKKNLGGSVHLSLYRCRQEEEEEEEGGGSEHVSLFKITERVNVAFQVGWFLEKRYVGRVPF